MVVTMFIYSISVIQQIWNARWLYLAYFNLLPKTNHSKKPEEFIANSRISLEEDNPPFLPPIINNPLPVGDGTIAESMTLNGNFGPKR